MSEPAAGAHTATLAADGSVSKERPRWRALIRTFRGDINTGYGQAMGYPAIDALTLRVLRYHLLALAVVVLLNAVIKLPSYIESPLGWRVITPAEAWWKLGLGALAAVAPWYLYGRVKNHYLWRLCAVTSLAAFSYLLVFVTGGSIEAHFHFFVIIAYATIYADWRLGWLVLLLTALHHTVLDFLRPGWVFHYGHNLIAPLVHVVFVAAAVGFATLLCRHQRNAIVSLELARRRNDEFLGIASHELRTPVTSIKAFVQVLQRRVGQDGDGRTSQTLGRVEHQVNRLSALIGDLLDATKIKKGTLPLRTSTFDFDAFIHDAAEELQVACEGHRIEVIGRSGKRVSADEDRLRQVLSNLVMNAVKYSPQADRVLIRLSDRRDLVRVEVIDYGIGISSENQRLLFRRFFRIEEPGHPVYPGLGLGLYITAEIIRRHKGKIGVESLPGKGSTFFIELPAS